MAHDLNPPADLLARGPDEEPDEEIVLALDIGSSSVRGAAFDLRGRPLSGLEAHAAVALHYAPGGVAEVPLDALTRGTEAVLDALHARLGGRSVRAVALTSIASSLVALDAQGQPTGPALSYADTRAAGEVDAVAQAGLEDEVGCPAFSAYWPAQIRWWQGQCPGQARQFCSVADALLRRWTGEFVTSYSLASWTGMLDRHSLRWNRRALALTGLDESWLPILTDHDHALCLSGPAARRWPRLAGAAFYPGIGDGASANVGSGALTPARVAVTIGSTSAVRMVVAGVAPDVPPGLWAYRVTRDLHLLGGALTEGGTLHSWLGRTLHPAGPELDAALLDMAPDRHGLTFVPSLGGTRSPDYDPHARGTLHGLSYATTPVQIVRAGMEAVACRLADLAARLPTAPDAVFVASGTALLASTPWQQMLADALGRPLLLEAQAAQGVSASARGAALLALAALGQPLPQPETSPPAGDQQWVEPVAAHHEVYRAAFARMQDLAERLRGM